MLYFAYGSNMLHERMMKRVPSAKPLGVYLLQEHDLRFHKVSKDGSGKADAFYTGRLDNFVFGVLYWISRQDKLALDAFEGRPNHYQMKWVDVLGRSSGKKVRAFTYCAVIIDETYVPYESYKNMVLVGARQHSLPNYYIDFIDSFEAKKDPVTNAVELAKRAVQRYR